MAEIWMSLGYPMDVTVFVNIKNNHKAIKQQELI